MATRKKKASKPSKSDAKRFRLTESERTKMSELNAKALTIRYGLDGRGCRTVQQVAGEMDLGHPAVQYHLAKAMGALTPQRRKEIKSLMTIKRGKFAKPKREDTPSARFANRLMGIRKARGLNQEEMADLLGLEHTTYQSYEAARNRPQMERFFSMCDALGMSPSEVLKGV